MDDLKDNCMKFLSEECTFSEIIALSIKYDLTDILAEKFEVSKSTVHRWASGVAKPHPKLKLQIVQFLMELTISSL